MVICRERRRQACLLLNTKGMMEKLKTRIALVGRIVVLLLICNRGIALADEPVTREQFLLLQQQNEQLQKQLQKQQELIDSLSQKVSLIQDVNARRDRELGDLKTEVKEASDPPPASGQSFHLGKVDISGEGGVAFFSSQSNGQTPHPEFRIDEARVFLEAPIWKEVYFFSELDLATPESTSLGLNVGELYLDFENVSQLWDRDRMLNIRIGRFYIPFGEEYLNRFAIDNPLISRSVSDLWGTDDGVELYGKSGWVQYVLAVQSGGGSTSQALQDDKAITGRIGFDPNPWLHLSVSGMRTGNLSVNNGVSASWFANGFFRSLGSSNTTTFHANLLEGDVQARLPWLQLRTAGGYINYGDNDPAANNHRDVYYYYVEGDHDFTRKFYGAARFSQIFAHNGFPIVGNGPMGEYLFGDLTTGYWRLSLGLGYRFSSNLLVKSEYSFNQGQEVDGSARVSENLFALEAAFKF